MENQLPINGDDNENDEGNMTDLGDISENYFHSTNLPKYGLPPNSNDIGRAEVHVNLDSVPEQRFSFTLTTPRSVVLEMVRLDAGVELILEDAHGNLIFSNVGGPDQDHSQGFVIYPLNPGDYFARVVATEAGDNAFTLRYSTIYDYGIEIPVNSHIPSQDVVLDDITHVMGPVKIDDGPPLRVYDEKINYEFTLTEARWVTLELGGLSYDANLRLLDGNKNPYKVGDNLVESTHTGTTEDWVETRSRLPHRSGRITQELAQT